ncbi:MAG: ABC transporter permease subunit/CPBP intramembrane protease [Planctomycetaceae bacterium]
MNWKNVRHIFMREIRDQLRDRRTLFMITILPVLLYPMLGLGVVEMMLTFSEQKRVVVILNADQLPQDPAFLDEDGICDQWFSQGKDESGKLQIVTDRPADADDDSDTSPRPGRRRSSADLLQAARSIERKFQELQQASSGQNSAADLSAIQDQLSATFADSGVQVLVLVPEGYAAATDRLRQLAAKPENDAASAEMPSLYVIRNSADDKSAVAFSRIRGALQLWEDSLRDRIFSDASLRPELQHPARLSWVEVARGEEVSANVWSKMFPTLLVIMTLTGAFYPAIDLGAGEKERGTMETLLISPARRIELVLGKFATILMFSIGTALMNLLSMGFTGRHMASAMGGALGGGGSLAMPGISSLLWLGILLIPLASLFSALCLALATFARSTKEGQYYLTPLLMVIMGLTMFCLSPSVEMTPLYSVVPVVNIALLLKGLLLNNAHSAELLGYSVPVLISSFGYSVLALWWAIDLYNSEGVLFREAEKFDVRKWFIGLTKDKEPVPAFAEATFCFIIILMLQFIAMNYLKPDLSLSAAEAGRQILTVTVVQQLTMIACPAVFMGLLLTTSLRATFRLRKPTVLSMVLGIALAVLAHPLSVEFSSFLVDRGFLPPPPEEGLGRINELLTNAELPTWLVVAVFAVTPAICEEIAFRGFILSGLARGGRLGIAVVISSLMFGIVHLIPQQAFNAALMGLILGLLAVYSRSLFPAIAFHLTNNAIAAFHARDGFGVRPDGTFFVHVEGQLRYGWPLLVFCGICVAVLVRLMVRALRREQEAKRLEMLKSFDLPVTNASAAS